MTFTIKHLNAMIQKAKGFDRLMNKLKITKLEKGCCVAELKVEEEHVNLMGGLHGGFSATLVDNVSSFALLTHDNGSVPSVSVDMHMTYSKGATLGDEILIDAQTIRAGKSLAFLKVLITNKNSGELLVEGSHTKFLMQGR